MIIAELKIPQMFSAYAEEMGYLQNNGLHHYQYFCEECDQIFSSAWGKIPSNMSCFERGNYFCCPSCGHSHSKNVAYIKRGELAPYKMRLVIKEYRNIVDFEVYSEAVYFNDYLSLKAHHYREVFRFDISKQTIVFTASDSDMVHNGKPNDPLDLGNPFKLDIFDASMLKFFNPHCLANSNQQKDLNKILKVLRETVHRKLEKHLGHKISSMYVSPGECNGKFLLPIFNIAYRVVCPDAPNLPEDYRYSQSHIKSFWWDRLIKKFDYFDRVALQTRKKQDFITALVLANQLPNKPLVRKLMAEYPFGVKLLTRSFMLCGNYDNATNLYLALLKYPHTYDCLNYSNHIEKNLIKFLYEMKPIFGEEGIIRLIADAKELNTRDCVRLYWQLNPENQRKIETERVRLKDLHNWMSFKHLAQNHKNIRYDIPDHIIKRLSMQSDKLKFFLPEESIKLLAAGHELHNCVASYSNNMKNNNLYIVLVADDKGKLVACLEIRNNELVQAKDNKNRGVSNHTDLNSAIIDWAKAAGIKIKTSDVKVPLKNQFNKFSEVVPA